MDFEIGTWASPVALNDATWTVLTGSVSTGSFLGILQGTQEDRRVGRKCVITDLHWKGRLRVPQYVTDSDLSNMDQLWDNIRLVLYIDKQTNGTAATASVLFQAATEDILSFRNIENSARFTIIHDKTYHIKNEPRYAEDSSVNVFSWIAGPIVKNFNIHWKGFLPIEYNSTAGSIAEIRSNNIGAIAISENPALGTNNPEIVSRVRLRFYG